MIEPDELERRLERLGERITPHGDAFVRLEQQIARRRRARRAGTVALALFVAIAGTSAALVAFDGLGGGNADTLQTAWTPPDVPTLWPESWADPNAPSNESAAQQRADAGDPTAMWRTDPMAVVRRFTLRRLGWPTFRGHVQQLDRISNTSGDVRFEASCGRHCLAGPATILLIQPERRGAGGIWSVVSVIDRQVRVSIEESAGTSHVALATAGGSNARVGMSMGVGFAGRGGFISTDGCSTTEGSSQPIGPPDGRWETAIPPAGSIPSTSSVGGCGTSSSAYLFGYIQSGEGGGGTGELFDPHVIVYHLTAIPLLVEAPKATDPSLETDGSNGVARRAVRVLLAGMLLAMLGWAMARFRGRRPEK